jgi:hypothetical protein
MQNKKANYISSLLWFNRAIEKAPGLLRTLLENYCSHLFFGSMNA